MTEPKTPVHVRCGPCGHRWVACYLPMEAMKAARTMLAARCPMCGSTSKQHFLDPDPATQPPEAQQEPSHAG